MAEVTCPADLYVEGNECDKSPAAALAGKAPDAASTTLR
jgi:hypothetical protein